MVNQNREIINQLIDQYTSKIKNIPKSEIEQLRIRYLKDQRNYDVIAKEITNIGEKILLIEKQINVKIDSNILSKSIILIGPMGSGKSTISYRLQEKLNMSHISLDNKDKLSIYYKKEREFNNFKDFEFYLTSSVLTNLQEPTIIDFGAGHSIYENKAMFLEIKNLISRFENVILLMPSKDKEESLVILNKRKGIEEDSHKYRDNKHFVNMPCNYELATLTIYTKDKTPNQIVDEIIAKVN